MLVGLLADVIGPLNALFISLAVSNFATLVPVVTANLFGVKRLASILGLLFFSYTLGTLVCSPVGGALLDKYGHGTNYTPLIIYDGSFFSAAMLLLGALRLAVSRSLVASI
ncbi:hypothetical protein GGF42_005903 [Coemansia sp. RSA 2424]|nr:hypothetical protein GGF42_005903 [Coemansia sp. RSA 2424]